MTDTHNETEPARHEERHDLVMGHICVSAEYADYWKRRAERAERENLKDAQLLVDAINMGVRPDVHAVVTMQRDAARREVEGLRSQLNQLAINAGHYQTECNLAIARTGALERENGELLEEIERLRAAKGGREG